MVFVQAASRFATALPLGGHLWFESGGSRCVAGVDGTC